MRKMRVLKTFHSVSKFYEKRTHFKRHKRFRVFWLKGTKCLLCNLEGNKVIKHLDRGKNVHYDLLHWTKEKKVLMTVDHIIPKSVGGTGKIENLQPLCSICNLKKGSTICLPYIKERIK